MLWLLSLIPGAAPVAAYLQANKSQARVLGVALAGLLAITMLWAASAAGRHAQRMLDRADAAAAITDARLKDAAAQARAETQRAADAAKIEQSQKDLTNAVANLPDSVPSSRRVHLGCVRLQHAGTDVSKLPQCR